MDSNQDVTIKDQREYLTHKASVLKLPDRSISSGGKIYTPAGVIAKEFGYSWGHVSLLARDSKIDAICINKRWYIYKPSVVQYQKEAKENQVQSGLRRQSVPSIVPLPSLSSSESEKQQNRASASGGHPLTRSTYRIGPKLFKKTAVVILYASGLLFSFLIFSGVLDVKFQYGEGNISAGVSFDKEYFPKQYSQIKQTVSADILDPLRNFVSKYLLPDQGPETYLAVDPYQRLETRIKELELRIKDQSDIIVPQPTASIQQPTQVVVREFIPSDVPLTSITTLEHRIETLRQDFSNYQQITPTVLQLPPTNTKGIGPITSNVDTVNTSTLAVTGTSTLSALTLSSTLSFTGTDHYGLRLNNLTTAERNALSPVAGAAIYNTSDTKMQVYNGTEWKNIGNPEVGGEVTSGTSGSILFVDSSGNLGQDNSNLFYDNTNDRLGIGTNAPSTKFEVQGTASASYLLTGNTLQVGGFSSASYSRFGTNTTTSSFLSSSNDLLISGKLEVDGLLRFDSGASISGNFTPTTDNTYTLGSADLRWKDINVGPGSFKISSTTGTSGATSNYTLGQISFTGSSLSFGTFDQGTGNPGTLEFKTASTSRMFIGSGGNVGIGTTSPTTKLDIIGAAGNNDIFRIASSSGDPIFKVTKANAIQVGGGASATEMRFLENSGNGANYVSLKSPTTLTSNVSWTLPNADGTSGQVLQTDGVGNLSWITKTEGLAQSFKGLTLRTHPDNDKAAAQVFLDHADEIVMDTGNRVTDWDDLTANIASSGAGGLDTGSEAASTWYEIYAIRKSSDGTKNLLLHRAKDYFKDEENTNSNVTETLRSDANTTKIAITFDTDESGPVEFIDTRIQRVSSPTGRMWAAIYNTSGGAPTGSTLTNSDKIDVSLVNTASQSVRFVFRNPVSLTAGTTYALVFEGDFTIDGTNYIRVADSNADPYAAGNNYKFNGTNWNSDATHDLWFKVYVTRNDTSVTMPSGYDQKAKVGYVYNDSDSNFEPFHAEGHYQLFVEAQEAVTSVATVDIGILTDLSAFIPPDAVSVHAGIAAGTDGQFVAVTCVPDGFGLTNSAPNFSRCGSHARSNGTGVNTQQAALQPVNTSHQGVYVGAGIGTAHVWINGFTWGSTGGADIAEEYLVHDESIEAGDIVALSNPVFYIEKASSISHPFGIVSTKPAIRIGGFDYNPQNNRAVALAGRVPVKVSEENGVINVGDRLTLSKTTPGVAMKQTDPGQSIGIAMESSENQDKVLTFLNLTYWWPSAESLSSTSSASYASESFGETASSSTNLVSLDSLTGYIVKKFKDVFGIVLEKGLLKVANIIAGNLKADLGSFKKIELEDEDTGEIYCIKIKNGELVHTKGGCGANNTEPELTPEPEVSNGEEVLVEEPVEETASDSEEIMVEESTPEETASPEPTPEPELTPETTS